MGKVSGRIGRAVLGCALVVVVAGVTGCTDQKGNKPAAPATEPVVTEEMPKYIEAANKANGESESTVIASAARPTVTEQNRKAMAMVIRDEGNDTWKAANYRLVVYCVGSGTVYAHFTLGAVAKITEVPPCAPTVTTGAVDIKLPSDAANSAVIIIPAGTAQAAVAYQ